MRSTSERPGWARPAESQAGPVFRARGGRGVYPSVGDDPRARSVVLRALIDGVDRAVRL